jgi:hypothetical protein
MKTFLCFVIALGAFIEVSKAQTNALTNGLVAYYPFQSNLNDQIRTNSPSISHNIVSITNDPTFGSVIFIDGIGGLSGSKGGYLEIPDPKINNDFTATFFIKELGMSWWHGESYLTAGSSNNSRSLLAHYGSDLGPPDHFASDTNLMFTGPSFSIDSNYISNTWNHYSIVCTSNVETIYMNGQALYTIGVTGTPSGN